MMLVAILGAEEYVLHVTAPCAGIITFAEAHGFRVVEHARPYTHGAIHLLRVFLIQLGQRIHHHASVYCLYRNVRQRLAVLEQSVDVTRAAPPRFVLIDPALTCLCKRGPLRSLLALHQHRIVAFSDHSLQLSYSFPSGRVAVRGPRTYRGFSHPVRYRTRVAGGPTTGRGRDDEYQALAVVVPTERKGLDFILERRGLLDVSHGGSKNLR